ncbi:hypothetical protein RI129_010996 [Pyrocoelia pectoralis]|uniref:tRNA (guanine-N(7)-)-methyltransferase non-catalytic subunit wuho n=1 Tax=Pyrocoelia pectoralis TaxID=417401 RepID=A0AAN7V028_9COLE
MLLHKNEQNLYIFIRDWLVNYNYTTSTYTEFQIHPPIDVSEKLSEDRSIAAVSVSKDNQLIAVALCNKQLVMYDRQFNILLNTICKRAVSALTFTHENNLLIADKTGDVFVYEFDKHKKEPDLLLGHLSMLLDIAISDCGKYVITCDRDEKIRVSSYPNAYNIVSFCLGHEEFVTNLKVYGNILISGSGDGTIRFWDFVNGKQLNVVNTNDYLTDKGIIPMFCDEMIVENVDVNALPIIDMQIYQSKDFAYLGVSVLGSNSVQIYRVTVSNVLNVQFLDVITVPSLLAFHLSEQLLIVSEDSFHIYNIVNNKPVKVNANDTIVWFDNFKHFLKDYVSQCKSLFSSLYKRKYDNVQEYLEKKKIRIENKS